MLLTTSDICMTRAASSSLKHTVIKAPAQCMACDCSALCNMIAREVRVTAIAIPTCDRPHQLQRCLLSYLNNLRTYDRQADFYVIDNSLAASTRSACREWLTRVARTHSLAIWYTGNEEKVSYIGKMEHLGLPRDVLEFALNNTLNLASSPGPNRNAVLLGAVGEAVLSCDDDSLCRIVNLRTGNQVLDVLRSVNPVETEFLSDARDCTRAVVGNEDLLAAHEALLGMPIDNLLPCAAGRQTVSEIPRSTEHTLEESCFVERVVVTASGVAGDSGMPDYLEFLLATGESRNRFLKHWASHGSAQQSRFVIRGVHRPSIAARTHIATTTATGFDNRAILPPFASSGRGEDTLFCALIEKCMPGCYLGFVPLALTHLPKRRGHFAPFSDGFTLLELCKMILDEAPPFLADSTLQRIRDCGQYLRQCSALPQSEFDTWVSHLVHQRQRRRIRLADKLLDTYGRQPHAWARELKCWLSLQQRGLFSSSPTVPRDCLQVDTLGNVNSITKHFLARFAVLLSWWPDIVDAARQLRARGERLGQQV